MGYSDRELIARIVECEANTEGENGMKAVATVIMNRVYAADIYAIKFITISTTGTSTQNMPNQINVPNGLYDIMNMRTNI